MALNDDDITTSTAAARVPLTAAPIPRAMTAAPTARRVARVTADGGSNPEGHDGGADGTAGGEGHRRRRLQSRGSRRRRRRHGVNRCSMLSRCIATDPQIFAREYWGRWPLLSRSDALPRDFSDLLSAEYRR